MSEAIRAETLGMRRKGNVLYVRFRVDGVEMEAPLLVAGQQHTWSGRVTYTVEALDEMVQAWEEDHRPVGEPLTEGEEWAKHDAINRKLGRIYREAGRPLDDGKDAEN